MARDRQRDVHLEEVAGAMLVVELLNRDAAAGESPEAALYLIDMLPQFGFSMAAEDCRLWKAISSGVSILRLPMGRNGRVPLRSATRPAARQRSSVCVLCGRAHLRHRRPGCSD